jgi:uncharacterized damage-inducible protein DinB
MIRLAACSFVLGCLTGQSFDPKLPAPAPPVEGPVQESPKVHYIDVRKGTGPVAAAGQRYSLVYSGWLRDGTKFSSADDAKHPFQFVQGRRQVIPGFELGFDGMRVGGKRRVFLPFQLAYGERGNPPAIPARAELIFDLELLAVEDVAHQPAAAELLLPFSEYEHKAMGLAKAVPEEKYDWRPAPGIRSFREVFLHIAYGNQLLLNVATQEPSQAELEKQIDTNARAEGQPVTKQQVLDTLAASFTAARKAMESARGGVLIHETQFFGQTTTQRGVFIALETHVAEHLGQAIAYGRMNGIAPPWAH